MTYAVQQDLIDRFGVPELIQLTDQGDPPTGEINAQAVTDALTDTDAEINGYLASRVTTPVADPPRILNLWACAIARYRLAKDHATDRMTTDYQSAIAWLKSFAAGQVGLGDSTNPTAPASGGQPVIQGGERTFTREALKNY